MLTIRDLKEEDAKIIFDWANDPSTRSNSLNTRPIKWEEHLSWLKLKLQAKNAWFYIVEDDKEPCSFVRFEEKNDKKIYIGIVVSQEFRGRGIGKKAIALGLERFFQTNHIPVFAQIRSENLASIKAFESNNFKLEAQDDILLYKREK